MFYSGHIHWRSRLQGVYSTCHGPMTVRRWQEHVGMAKSYLHMLLKSQSILLPHICVTSTNIKNIGFSQVHYRIGLNINK